MRNINLICMLIIILSSCTTTVKCPECPPIEFPELTTLDSLNGAMLSVFNSMDSCKYENYCMKYYGAEIYYASGDSFLPIYLTWYRGNGLGKSELVNASFQDVDMPDSLYYYFRRDTCRHRVPGTYAYAFIAYADTTIDHIMEVWWNRETDDSLMLLPPELNYKLIHRHRIVDTLNTIDNRHWGKTR